MALKISKRVKALIVHDVVVVVGAFVTALEVGNLDKATIVAAAVAALKVGVRQVVPVPALEDAARLAPAVVKVVDAEVPAAKPVVDAAEKVIADAATPADAADKVAP